MCPEKDFNLILMRVKWHILHPLHHEKTQRSRESHDDHHEELPGQQNITTVEERHSCKNRLREGAFNWQWIEFISNTLPLFNGQWNFKCIFFIVSFMCQTEGKLLVKHRLVFSTFQNLYILIRYSTDVNQFSNSQNTLIHASLRCKNVGYALVYWLDPHRCIRDIF